MRDRWSDDEHDRLRTMWYRGISARVLLEAFPDRTLSAIRLRASLLGLTGHRLGVSSEPLFGDSPVTRWRAENSPPAPDRGPLVRAPVAEAPPLAVPKVVVDQEVDRLIQGIVMRTGCSREAACVAATLSLAGYLVRRRRRLAVDVECLGRQSPGEMVGNGVLRGAR